MSTSIKVCPRDASRSCRLGEQRKVSFVDHLKILGSGDADPVGRSNGFCREAKGANKDRFDRIRRRPKTPFPHLRPSKKRLRHSQGIGKPGPHRGYSKCPVSA